MIHWIPRSLCLIISEIGWEIKIIRVQPGVKGSRDKGKSRISNIGHRISKSELLSASFEYKPVIVNQEPETRDWGPPLIALTRNGFINKNNMFLIVS